MKLPALLLLIAPLWANAQDCNVEDGARVWTKCAACHSLDPSVRGMAAPTLSGLFGRPAGRVPGFSYSAALKAANFTWDDTSFDEFLADPQGRIPGTAMAFSGLRKPDARKAVACYIRQNSQTPKH